MIEPLTVDQWNTILGRIPAPEGVNADKLCAERVLGDMLGYQSGNTATRQRRQAIKDHDAQNLTNAMLAFARMYYDAGVRP